MTNCSGKQADDFLESYLAGTLPEAESQRFEEHYFDCPDCLAQVEALQAVAQQLRNRPVSVASSPARPVLRLAGARCFAGRHRGTAGNWLLRLP